MRRDLSEAWFKNLWDKEIRATPHPRDDILAGVKAYKAAQRGKSKGRLIEALEDLEKRIVASAKRNQKRKDLRPEQFRLLDTQLGYVCKDIDKKIREIESAGGKMVTVYNIDFGTVVQRVNKGDVFIKEKRPLKVEMLDVVADEIDAVGAAPDLYRQIDRRVEQSARDYVRAVQSLMNDRVGERGMDQKKLNAMARDESDRVVQDLRADLKRVPTDVMRRVRIHRDIAKKYRKEKAVSIGKGVVSTGLAAGGLAVPGSTPFAAVMLARSICATAKEIAETAMTLKRKVKIFEKTLAELSRAYESHKGEKEIARDAVNAVLGVDVVPTLDKAKGQLKDIEKDVASTLFRARQINKDVEKALARTAKLEDKLDKLSTKHKGLKKSQLKMQLSQGRRDVDKLADQVYRLMKHAALAEDKVPEMRRGLVKIDTLKGRVEKAKLAIRSTIAASTALAGMGDAASASQLASAAEKLGALGLAFEGTMETAHDIWQDASSLA